MVERVPEPLPRRSLIVSLSGTDRSTWAWGAVMIAVALVKVGVAIGAAVATATYEKKIRAQSRRGRL